MIYGLTLHQYALSRAAHLHRHLELVRQKAASLLLNATGESRRCVLRHLKDGIK